MHATGDYTIAELMEVFSISRATVYRVLDRAGARPGAGTGAQSYETVGEVVMLMEVLADGVRALVISQADEKRVVRLAEPLLHQPLRAGDSPLLESWSGYVYERIPKAEVEELILEEGERGQTGGGYAVSTTGFGGDRGPDVGELRRRRRRRSGCGRRRDRGRITPSGGVSSPSSGPEWDPMWGLNATFGAD
jgi:hypothetical protein